MRSSLALLAAGAALAACGAPATSASVVVAEVRAPATLARAGDALPLPMADPTPRLGAARRFLRLASAEAGGAPVHVAMEVPAAWGIRARAGELALRPCQVSPSSPGELFVAARRCSGAACAEHE